VTHDGLRSALEASLGDSYKIDHELIGGGMSRVFTARDEQLGRDVVVKVIAPDLAAGISLDRFAREIRLAASLQEPHIIPVLGAGVTQGGLPYYITPYLRGESLRARVARERMPVTECIGVLRDVARALSYAHRQGVIHRDIKPENVLMSYGSAVVTDFGIAKALVASRGRTGRLDTPTQPMGTALGTPAYMAPEQATGEEVDARSDLYAWGVVAYEALSGEHPFPGERTSQQYLVAHVSEAPVHLMLKLPDAPVALCELVMRCLEKEPVRRPVAATELVRLLDDPTLMSPESTPREQALLSARSGRQTIIVLAAAVAIVAFVFGSPLVLARLRGVKAPTSALMIPEGTPLSTLAVLPFENEGGDAQNEYLASGMTDELAHALARLPDIRITGRTSSAAYQGKAINPLQIGKALNVGGVVTGSVRREGSRIHVSVRLSSANDGRTVWDESFDRPATDIFVVQDEMTRQIVKGIAPKVTDAVAALAAETSRGTTDLMAYDLLMRGRYYLARGGVDDLPTAIGYFQRAVATDTKFARAHADLAISHAALSNYVNAADSLSALAMTEARRALTLDRASPDAHLAMALALSSSLHYAEAETHFTTALRAMPGDARPHQWHADNLLQLGRPTEALTEIRHALELDSASPTMRQSLMGIELSMRQFDSVVADGERLAAMDSSLMAPRILTALALTFQGRADSATRVLDNVLRRYPRSPGLRSARLLSYAAAGRWNDASRVRGYIADSRPRSDYDALVSAIVFGETRRALYLLEQAGTRGSDIQNISWSISCDPVFDPIKKEPRFVAFTQARGMTICPITTPWPVVPRLLAPSS
jgi:serine/threonine-protein kinase